VGCEMWDMRCGMWDVRCEMYDFDLGILILEFGIWVFFSTSSQEYRFQIFPCLSGPVG